MDGPVAGRHRKRNGRGVVEEALAVVEAAGGDAWCGWGRRKQRLICVRTASALAIHDGTKSRRSDGRDHRIRRLGYHEAMDRDIANRG